jgi:Mrp family chromosome partitioning ATPase
VSKHPPRLLLGGLTGRVYVTTAYRVTKQGQIISNTKARRYAVISHKGGSGKTIVAVNLAGAWAAAAARFFWTPLAWLSTRNAS